MTQEATEVLDYAQQLHRKPPQTTSARKKSEAAKPKSKPISRERSNKVKSTKPPQRGTSSKSISSGKFSTPLELSDSDLSSSSEVEELVQQKREAGEMTDRIRAI